MAGQFAACIALLARICLAIPTKSSTGPFLQTLNGSWVIGNDLWNITQSSVYGKKLYYQGRDLIGDAVGHYVGFDGENNLVFTSGDIYSKGEDFIDVRFTAKEGEFHWVIFDGLPGAYQYFVNRALPVLGVFRTLVRLDNETFTNGRTPIKDEALPPLSDIQHATKVQDETWQRVDGTYITKYDWSTFIRPIDFYGVYGKDFGSWYIRPGGDYFNGDHLKQELIVHRESSTGDAVQLNVVHGSHFMASANDYFPNGKIFGPWLWYLNDGSKEDAAARAKKEFAAWPYGWLRDEAYQSRVETVSGRLLLSNGRPAAGAAVFLGDNHPNETTLDQGRYYNYVAYADNHGNFAFKNVRTGSYGLQAWSNGGSLSDLSATYLRNDIVANSKSRSANLSTLKWTIPSNRTNIFQIGDFDRKSIGFKYGGAPYQHALVDKSPANLTYTVGKSKTEEWYFAQSAIGIWNINFSLDAIPKGNRSALLTVSLASYSKGVSSLILVNGQQIGNLSSSSIPSDPALYRSGTTAGEWHLFEFSFDGSEVLKRGGNTVSFAVQSTTLWHGFMWDAIRLDWV